MITSVYPLNEVILDPALATELVAQYYQPGYVFTLTVSHLRLTGATQSRGYNLPDNTDLTATLAAVAEDLEKRNNEISAAMVGGRLLVRHRFYYRPEDIHLEISYYDGAIGHVIYSAYGSQTSYNKPSKSTSIISGRPGPWSNPPEVMVLSNPIVETTPSGWDQMRERLLVPYTPYFECGQRREHMLDERAAPFARLLAQEERVVGFHGPWPIVELLSMGFAREKPWIVQTTQDSQGQVGGGGVIRNLPTVTVTWFSETLENTKLVVPSPAVPPETFDWVALSITSGLSNNVGWIIVKRDIDPLPVITGSTPQVQTNAGNVTRTDANLNPRPSLCKVVDYYVYDWETSLPPLG